MRPAAATQLLRPVSRIAARPDAAFSRRLRDLLPSRNEAQRLASSRAFALVPPRPLATESRRSASVLSRLGALPASLRLSSASLAAQAKPDDVATQKEYFALLLETANGKQENPDQVIRSYEEKSGIFSAQANSSNAFLVDTPLFDVYVRALTLTENAADKVAAAYAKRASILAAGSSTSAAAAPAESAPTSAATSAPAAKPSLTKEQLTQSIFPPGEDATVVSSNAPKYAGAAAAGTVSAGNSDVIKVHVTHQKDPIWWRVLRPIISSLLWLLAILTIISFVMESGSGGIMKAAAGAGPNEFKPSPGSEPVKFSDVHGCEEAKAELQEVVEFLKDPTKFSKLGGKLTRGVLLTGPPGTGKTLLARAVAGEAGVSFFIASGSDFDEMFVGIGARRIRELFSAARKGAPAIIFIDELDAVGGKRSPRDMQYMKQTLNQLLVEMDGFAQGSGIVVIGATNLPESLDKALVRPGRFDRHIAVPLPDVRGRLAILQHHAAKNKVPYDEKLVDFATIARGTPGFSGAELEALINQAAVRASLDNSERVLPRHLEWARDRIMLGSERKSAVVTPESRKRTAGHEAGHAIMALFTPGTDPLHKITVVPRGHALGITFQLPEMDRDSQSFAELKAKLDVCMGGRAAEEMIYGHDNVTSGAASDIEQATKIANAMVRRFGFSEAVGPVSVPEEESQQHSSETRAIIEKEVRGLIESAQARAVAMLQAKKVELERLASALITYETLTGEEAKRVIRGEAIEKPVL